MSTNRRFTLKSKSKTRKNEDELIVDEAEFNPDLDKADFEESKLDIVNPKDKKTDDEQERRKIAKKRNKRKQKMQSKGFDIVSTIDEHVDLDLTRPYYLHGSIDDELDGVNTVYDKHVKYRNKELVKTKRKASEINDSKSNKKFSLLKNEQEHCLSLIDNIASKQEEWSSSKIDKERKKEEYLAEKKKLKEEKKEKMDKLVEEMLLAEKLKRKEKAKLLKESR